VSFTQTLFGFTGRIARLPYFGYSILVGILFIATMVAGGVMIAAVAGGQGRGGAALLGLLVIACGFIAFLWAGVALMVKRLHDLGMSGLHAIWIYAVHMGGSLVAHQSPALAILLYLAAFCIALWLWFGPGQPAANEYGPVPGERLAVSLA
jgi:uncharacterized membrane protein YhaH (DUF805 family)